MGAEQARGALDDEREQAAGIQLGSQLALGLGEHGDLSPARGLEREEAGVLERQRRLVAEGLEQPDLRLGEDPPGHVAERQRADDPVLRPERHREHGGVAGAPHRGSDRVGQHE